MKNKVEDLRNHLFETLEALKDKDAPMDIEPARAIADVAQTIINSARVEVEFLKATGNTTGSGFITIEDASTPRHPARLAKVSP
jgi:hypothetical protein